MKSVTKAKLKKIQSRARRVSKEQAVLNVSKQKELKFKNQLESLKEQAFNLSNPVERLKKSRPLKETRKIEVALKTVKDATTIPVESRIPGE